MTITGQVGQRLILHLLAVLFDGLLAGQDHLATPAVDLQDLQGQDLADEVGQIHCPNPALVGGALVGMLESFHSMPDFAVRESKPLMAKELIDILLRGLNYRGSDTINFNSNKELS